MESGQLKEVGHCPFAPTAQAGAAGAPGAQQRADSNSEAQQQASQAACGLAALKLNSTSEPAAESGTLAPAGSRCPSAGSRCPSAGSLKEGAGAPDTRSVAAESPADTGKSTAAPATAVRCPYAGRGQATVVAADAGSRQEAGSAAKGVCPFSGALAPPSSALPAQGLANTANSRTGGKKAACPYSGAAASASAAGANAASAISPAEISSAAATWPMGFGSSGAGASASGSGPANKKGVCPLGFSSGDAPALTPLHCMRCKAFFCDPVRPACGHVFCAGCLVPFADCPVCGADVEGVTPDTQLQGMVETFLRTHAPGHTLWELDAGLPAKGTDGKAGGASGEVAAAGASSGGAVAAGSSGPGARGLAGVLLQLGVRAQAAGNLPGAVKRLQQCREELECEGAELGEPVAAGSRARAVAEEWRCRLGAVCGSLGDCHQRLGDRAQAAASYEASIAALRGGADGGNASAAPAERRHALSVSLNKLGDLHLAVGGRPAAAHYYQQALDIRRRLYEDAGSSAPPGRRGGASPGSQADTGGSITGASAAAATAAALDVAASLVKLGGVVEAGGEAGAAASAYAEARLLLSTHRVEREQHGAVLAAKYDALQTYLAERAGAE